MQHPYILTLLFVLSSVLVPPAPARDTASRNGEPPAGNPVPAKPVTKTGSGTKPSKNREGGRKKRSPRKPIVPADYAQWEQLNMGSRRISRDGQWLVFGIRRVDEKGSLHLHRIK